MSALDCRYVEVLAAYADSGTSLPDPQAATISQLQAEIARMREALKPSAATKAAYIGEFHFNIEDRDEDGEECTRRVTVPWTTVKEIMKVIAARAALGGSND